MELNVQEDTMELSLTAEKTITNTTVKITTTVVVAIDGTEITNENLAEVVRTALNDFVDGEWTFANPNRRTDEVGGELATFNAVTRVDESENHNLVERAEAASRKGLRISGIQTDTTNPTRAIILAESDLRVDLVKAAKDEADRLSEAFGHQYRVAHIEFQNCEVDMMSNRPRASMAYIATSENGFGSAAGGLIGHSQKITMQANVRLASPRRP